MSLLGFLTDVLRRLSGDSSSLDAANSPIAEPLPTYDGLDDTGIDYLSSPAVLKHKRALQGQVGVRSDQGAVGDVPVEPLSPALLASRTLGEYPSPDTVQTPSSAGDGNSSSSSPRERLYTFTDTKGAPEPYTPDYGRKIRQLRIDGFLQDSVASKLPLLPHPDNTWQVFVTRSELLRALQAAEEVEGQGIQLAQGVCLLQHALVAVHRGLDPHAPQPDGCPPGLPVAAWEELLTCSAGAADAAAYMLAFVLDVRVNSQVLGDSVLVLQGWQGGSFEVAADQVMDINITGLPYLRWHLCELHLMQLCLGPDRAVRMGQLHVAAWRLHVLDKVAAAAHKGEKVAGLLEALPPGDMEGQLLLQGGADPSQIPVVAGAIQSFWVCCADAWIAYLSALFHNIPVAHFLHMPFESQCAALLQQAAATYAAAVQAAVAEEAQETNSAGAGQQEAQGGVASTTSTSSGQLDVGRERTGGPAAAAPAAPGAAGGQASSSAAATPPKGLLAAMAETADVAAVAAQVTGTPGMSPSGAYVLLGLQSARTPDSSGVGRAASDAVRPARLFDEPQEGAAAAAAEVEGRAAASTEQLVAAGREWQAQVARHAVDRGEVFKPLTCLGVFPMPAIIQQAHPGIRVRQFVEQFTDVGYSRVGSKYCLDFSKAIEQL